MKVLKGQQSTKAGLFQFYKSSDGWRWRLRASNGAIIATGGEAYSSRQQVIKGIHTVIEYASTVAEERPDHLIHKPIAGRHDILCGCGTKIRQEGFPDEDPDLEHDHD